MTSKLEAAIAAARAANFEAALRELDPLTLDGECRVDALGHRAGVYRGLGRLDDALRDYEAILAERPYCAPVLAARAETWLLAGELERAAKGAAQALGRDPFDPTALRVLRRCHEARGGAELTTAVSGAPERAPNPIIEKMESDTENFPISAPPELGRLLTALVRCARPRLALEVGCFIGYSTLCLAQGLKENGGGHLHSFDLFVPQPGYADPYRAACANIAASGLAEFVSLHQGDSSTRHPRAVRRRAGPVRFCLHRRRPHHQGLP